ncbi:MAG: hypothetical protein U0166_00030 [Acidobacteriota bacterium]
MATLALDRRVRASCAEPASRIEVERIGARVYRETYDQARARFAALRARRDLPAIAKALAYANLKSLAMLHAWGRVDYAVFLARRE